MSFNTWRDYQNFAHDVKFKSRFVQSPEVNEFLLNIEKSIPDRELVLASGNILYRGQIGYDEYESEGQLTISGYPPQRMKPILNRGKEGRGNPKGISYLYLSNDENTALAELRPHLGQYISSAQFQLFSS